jgi:RNA polymerase sigma factor (TIGR02999 family)
MPEPGEITRLLGELRAGRQEVQAQLMEAVYGELHKIAGRLLQRERTGHTLQATALVNEAYMQMVGDARLDWKDRSHFFAAAAQSMRHILVDYARRHKAAKRDGALHKVELTDGLAITEDRLEEVLAIDEALTRLAEWDARQCRVVEMRFFGGMNEEEIAEVLGVGRRTVSRDWNLARAWLHGELNRPPAGSGSSA